MRRTVTSSLAAISLLVLTGAATGIGALQIRTATVGSMSVTGVTAAEGTANTLARSDHAHSLTGTLPQVNGGTGAGALTCGAGEHITSNGTVYSCTADSGGGAPTTAQYWVGAADSGLSAEKDLSGFTGLVLNTAGVPTSKAANTCTNQFARSDTASGAWTCAGVTATTDFAANQGTTSQTLMGNASGQPTWVQNTFGVSMTQDRTINATTAASTTDLVWAIAANQGMAFTCNLTSTSTATSKIRYAVAGPASMTYMNCRVTLGTTSLTTLVSNTLQAQWASTCTGCTNSVTSSVLTSKITDVLSCSVVNGANAGNITIYFADSTASQVNTLHKGSSCLVTKL